LEVTVPTVAGKKYPYTKKGKAQARRAKKNVKSTAWTNANKARAARQMKMKKKA
jgi:hypothetical protein